MGFRRQATCSDCSDADSDAVVHPPLVGSDWIGSDHGCYGQTEGEGREAPADQLLHQYHLQGHRLAIAEKTSVFAWE